MGGNSTYINGYGTLTIPQALEIARNSEQGVNPAISRYLEQSLAEIWMRVNAAPSTYILTPDEFALFNYNRARYENTPYAQRAIDAVDRFWKTHRGIHSG